jgi:hypothetical protein
MTLLFQPAAYWAGDYSQAQENTEVYYLLMASHPALFVAGVVVDMAISCLATLAVAPRFGRYIVMALSCVHIWAATTWLWLNMRMNNWLYGVPGVLLSLFLLACLERSIRWQHESASERFARESDRRESETRPAGLRNTLPANTHSLVRSG